MANMNDAALRNSYLNAMGIDVWVRRGSERVTEEVTAAFPTVRSAARDAIVVPHPQPSGAVAVLDWDALAARVAGCTLCELHTTRTQTVFGVGNRNADWLVIGEAPGADEDQQGEPFVGRAGQLLNAMLFAIGLQREHCKGCCMQCHSFHGAANAVLL